MATVLLGVILSATATVVLPISMRRFSSRLHLLRRFAITEVCLVTTRSAVSARPANPVSSIASSLRLRVRVVARWALRVQRAWVTTRNLQRRLILLSLRVHLRVLRARLRLPIRTALPTTTLRTTIRARRRVVALRLLVLLRVARVRSRTAAGAVTRPVLAVLPAPTRLASVRMVRCLRLRGVPALPQIRVATRLRNALAMR